ncbi:unnamed protein product, partial [Heterosigma akashiwo]
MLYISRICSLQDQNDTTKITLLNANNTEDDIILHKELDALAQQHPRQCKIWHTILQPELSTHWFGEVGYIDERMMARRLPSPGPSVLVLLCGPDAMLNFSCW